VTGTARQTSAARQANAGPEAGTARQTSAARQANAGPEAGTARQTGAAREAPTAPQAASGQVGAMQAALAAEHAASYGYGVVGAQLTGAQRRAAVGDWVANQKARDSLEAMLRARGVQPDAAAVAYRLPFAVRTARDAVSLAVILEDRVAAAYLGMVAADDVAVREFGALQLRAAALRAAFWRGSTVAFPGLPASALEPRHSEQ
jgi:Domain of unknown function (DUF4439)